MASTFNSQILVEKLAKLNSSQASIETLSHWCIFHMNKAKQVVETWDRQFHSSPREQRLAFLYLANDILQNSRRKGAEFVGEFWKVLPDALRDVIDNGDEYGRNAAQRLIVILEDRKVFGSRGQILKDELVGKHAENSNRNMKQLGTKLRQPAGSTLDKIVSGYQVVYGGQLDEDVAFGKCRNAISCLEKVNKEIASDLNAGQLHGASFMEEFQVQQAVLRESIGQLTAIESSRASLVLLLREALQEQESKLEQVRNQLQAAQSQSEHTDSMYQQSQHSNNTHRVAEGNSRVNTSVASQSLIAGDMEQADPAVYSQQVSFSEKTSHIKEDPRKSAAAAVAAKLTASTSSAQMLSYVLSTLASEGVISNPVKESSGDYRPEKRAKLENDQPYVPSQNPSQFSLSSFQQSESFHHNVGTTAQQLNPNEPPPPPSSPPPPLPPPPAVQPYPMPSYMQTAGSVNGVPYGYVAQQQPIPFSGYPAVGTTPTAINSFTMAPANSFQSFQGAEGNVYSQATSMPTVPISRQ